MRNITTQRLKNWYKISCYRCNSHVGSAVIFHICAQGVCHSSRLICSLMTSSATGRLRLGRQDGFVPFQIHSATVIKHQVISKDERACSRDSHACPCHDNTSTMLYRWGCMLGIIYSSFFFSTFLLSHHLDKGSSLSHRSINTVPKLFWLTFVIFCKL